MKEVRGYEKEEKEKEKKMTILCYNTKLVFYFFFSFRTFFGRKRRKTLWIQFFFLCVLCLVFVGV